MGRAPCCDKVGLRRGRWSAEEDAILINYLIKRKGEEPAVSWRSLPKKAGLLRCGKSCRLRWINYLRSDLRRGNFTSHEQDTIIKLHSSLGNKWSAIASQLEGRTDNEIKNYWNSTLCRRTSTSMDTLTNNSQKINTLADGEVVNVLQTISNQASASTLGKGRVTAIKKRRGRTSRAAMKKNKLSIYGKSNKYHLAASTITNQAPYESNPIYSTTSSSYGDDHRAISSILSRSNNINTTNGTCSFNVSPSSALTLQKAPNESDHEDQISSDNAMKGSLILDYSLLGCESQNDFLSNIANQINEDDMDVVHHCGGVGLSFGDDIGTIYSVDVDELVVNVDRPSNDCLDIGDNAKEKYTMEAPSELLLDSSNSKQATQVEDNNTLQSASLSDDWYWINDHIVLQDSYNYHVWSDEHDGTLTWLQEYHEYAHHHQ